MPEGKPAHVACVHLTERYECGLWEHPERPAACSAFEAEPTVCGNTRSEAMRLLGELERATHPD